MALWGNRDSYAITGTANTAQNSTTITGTGTAFLTEVDQLDSLYIDGTHVKVTGVDTNTSLTLGSSWAANTITGQTLIGQDSPKYIPTAQITEIFGVDTTEAQVVANKAKGIDTPGWVRHVTYTDMHGSTRTKTEVLVAMSSITGDAPDDSTVADS
jgi:hypothetical protein